jgi:hypothetical protein
VTEVQTFPQGGGNKVSYISRVLKHHGLGYPYAKDLHVISPITCGERVVQGNMPTLGPGIAI